MRRLILPAFFLAGLSACGGDDGATPAPTPTPTSTPAPTNTPPTFTSAATASVPENSMRAFQALASDAQNDPVTVAISGGADAALFSMDATGMVSFRTAPDFDMPGDADGNNIYEVIVSASDGKATTLQTVQVTVTNSREGMALHRVATGFEQPIQVYRVDGDANQLYVGERGGRIYRLDIRTGNRTLLLTIGSVPTDGERGLIGFAVGKFQAVSSDSPAPSFYTLSTALNGAVVVGWFLQNPYGYVFPSYVGPTLLSVPHAEFNNHNGGWIELGPGSDGLTSDIYVGIGDGGGAGDPNNHAQDPGSRLGKILRLSRRADPYAGASIDYWGPSPDNPYRSGGGDPYVFALGLRNPFRGSFEGNTLIIGDVGQGAVEEVDTLSTSDRGANLGWPYLEGTASYKGSAPGGLVPPKLQYRHGSGPFQGASVIGGNVYHGPIQALNGHYLFADFVSKHIWSVPYSRLLSGPLLDGSGFSLRDADLAPDAGTLDQPVAFGKDSAGNVYIVDLDGEIFQIVADPTSA